MQQLGATLVAISPQLPEFSAKIAKRHKLALVFCAKLRPDKQRIGNTSRVLKQLFLNTASSSFHLD